MFIRRNCATSVYAGTENWAIAIKVFLVYGWDTKCCQSTYIHIIRLIVIHWE